MSALQAWGGDAGRGRGSGKTVAVWVTRSVEASIQSNQLRAHCDIQAFLPQTGFSQASYRHASRFQTRRARCNACCRAPVALESRLAGRVRMCADNPR